MRRPVSLQCKPGCHGAKETKQHRNTHTVQRLLLSLQRRIFLYGRPVKRTATLFLAISHRAYQQRTTYNLVFE